MPTPHLRFLLWWASATVYICKNWNLKKKLSIARFFVKTLDFLTAS
jgi:hypothetical protein